MSMTGMMFTSVTGCVREAARRRRRPSALLRQGSATWTSHGAGAAGWIVSIACTHHRGGHPAQGQEHLLSFLSNAVPAREPAKPSTQRRLHKDGRQRRRADKPATSTTRVLRAAADLRLEVLAAAFAAAV